MSGIDSHRSASSAEPTVAQLGAARGGKLPDRLTPLEAVAWIATGSRNFAAGVTPVISHLTAAGTRGMGVAASHIAELTVVSIVADEIAGGHCSCERPHVDKGALRTWNALSPDGQARARSERKTDLAYLREEAEARRCECFDLAARRLFDAAAAGELSAGALLHGSLRGVDRPEWIHARLSVDHGLILPTAGWTSITFATAAIMALWPGTFVVNGLSYPLAYCPAPKRGRPSVASLVAEMLREFAGTGCLAGHLPTAISDATSELSRRAGPSLILVQNKTYARRFRALHQDLIDAQKL